MKAEVEQKPVSSGTRLGFIAKLVFVWFPGGLHRRGKPAIGTGRGGKGTDAAMPPPPEDPARHRPMQGERELPTTASGGPDAAKEDPRAAATAAWGPVPPEVPWGEPPYG